jgi:hypothetical protein
MNTNLFPTPKVLTECSAKVLPFTEIRGFGSSNPALEKRDPFPAMGITTFSKQHLQALIYHYTLVSKCLLRVSMISSIDILLSWLHVWGLMNTGVLVDHLIILSNIDSG